MSSSTSRATGSPTGSSVVDSKRSSVLSGLAQDLGDMVKGYREKVKQSRENDQQELRKITSESRGGSSVGSRSGTKNNGKEKTREEWLREEAALNESPGFFARRAAEKESRFEDLRSSFEGELRMAKELHEGEFRNEIMKLLRT